MTPDYLRTIKLGHGQGTPYVQGCWMTALNAHLGGEWTDQCSCVDPVINWLCIAINDMYYDDEDRTKDILEFGLFEPLGTKGDEKITKKRLFKLVDVVVRQWFFEDGPVINEDSVREFKSYWDARKSGPDYGYKLEITCQLSHFLQDPYGLMSLKTHVLRGAKIACQIDKILNNLTNSDYFYFVCFAVDRIILELFKYDGFSKLCRQKLLPLLRELIDMGPHAPIEPTCNIEKFQKLVGIN